MIKSCIKDIAEFIVGIACRTREGGIEEVEKKEYVFDIIDNLVGLCWDEEIAGDLKDYIEKNLFEDEEGL